MRAGFNHKGTGGNKISVLNHGRSSQTNAFLCIVPARFDPTGFLRDLRGRSLRPSRLKAFDFLPSALQTDPHGSR